MKNANKAPGKESPRNPALPPHPKPDARPEEIQRYVVQIEDSIAPGWMEVGVVRTSPEFWE